MSVSIRQLGPDDAATFQAIRLQGLREDPHAFGSTYAEDSALSLDTIAQRLTPSRAPVGRAVFGAFADADLVGFVGCMQEPKIKSRHKAIVWGTYVAPAWRGHGIARRLLEHLIAEAGAWPDVQRIILTVVERAESARRLYRSVGFETFAREPDALRQDGISDTIEYMALSLRRDRDFLSPASS